MSMAGKGVGLLSRSEFTELVLAAMDASTNPDAWPEVCDKVVSAFDATAFAVFEYDFSRFGSPRIHASRDLRTVAGDAIDATQSDPPPAERDLFRRFADAPPMELMTEAELYGVPHDLDLPPNPFRDNVLAALGSKSRNAAKMNDVGPFADVAAIHLPVFGAELPRTIRAGVAELIPVFGKALESQRIIQSLAVDYARLMTLFDRLDFGVAFCRADGRILSANRSFAAMAADRDGLTDQGHVAGAVHAGDQKALATMLANAQKPDTPPDRLVLALRRRSGQMPLIAKAMPVRETEIRRSNTTLLIVLDPEDRTRLNARGLSAFGLLTEAEQEVCEMLVQGLSAPEIALRRDTTPETARGQAKAVSAKLACRSRLDIVRLAIATTAPVRSK